LRTCWIPNPSRTWNTLSVSPRGPKCSWPSVMTPSTSSTRRRMAAAAFRDIRVKSHDAGAEEIVHIEGAHQPSALIHNGQRRDAMDFHQMHRLRSQLSGADCLAVDGHDGAHGCLVHIDLPVERTAQVTVGEHSQDLIVAIDDDGHPQSLAGH